MYFIQNIILLLFLACISGAVKIGISKPVTVAENSTTDSMETTTLEPATTSTTTAATTTTTTTTRKTTVKPVKTTSTSTTTTTTTTGPPSTTTATTTTPAPSPPPKNNTKLSSVRNQNVDYSKYYCSCDLRRHHCDINCCCDIDCLAEELKSFDCKQEETHLENFNYQQGLPPCKINEGWLCVFRNNFDDTKHREIKYVTDPAAYYKWPDLLLESNDMSKDRNYYKIGEPILIYNLEVNEIVEYDIPFSLTGQRCQIVESIRHLTSQKSSCYTTLEKVQNLEATLFQKLCTSFLLQGPSTRIPIDGTITEAQTDFLPITLFRCTNDLDCMPASVNNSYNEDFDYSPLIQTKIYHNITNLISCDVFFFRSSLKLNDKSLIWQHYEVKFIHINETDFLVSNISGPLGYNPGSPLIVGKKVLLNETADHIESNLVLNYFHPNRTEGIHIHVPRRRQGQCEESPTTVNFGESILTQCAVQLENSTDLSSETNFTRVCGELQARSLTFLGASEILELQEDYFVSVLGYPVNRTDRWIKMEVRNYEHIPVVGVYSDKEYSFTCQNMILGMKYEFFNVKDDIQSVKHQNVLRRAAIEVGRRHDLQFELNEAISIPITFSAIFNDLREISYAVRRAASRAILFLSISILVYS